MYQHVNWNNFRVWNRPNTQMNINRNSEMSALDFRNDLVSKLTAAKTPLNMFTFSDPVITQYVLKVRLNPPGAQNSFSSHHNSRLLDQDLTHKPNNMNLQNTKQFVIVVHKWALAWSCCLGLILRAARLVPDVSSGKMWAENSLLLNQRETARSRRYSAAENFRVSLCHRAINRGWTDDLTRIKCGCFLPKSYKDSWEICLANDATCHHLEDVHRQPDQKQWRRRRGHHHPGAQRGAETGVWIKSCSVTDLCWIKREDI